MPWGHAMTIRDHATRTRLLGVVLAATVALAGCSGDQGGEGEDGERPVTEGLTEETLVPTIRLVGPSTSYQVEQYEINRLTLDYWENELGLTTEYETTPDWSGFTGAVAEMDWHAASAGFLGSPFRIDPDELLSRPLMCEFGDGGSNYGDYCHEEYDEVVEQQKAEFDTEARRELVYRAQEIQAEDIPLVSVHPAEGYVWNAEAFDDVVPAVGQGLDNFWNAIDARPIGDDTTYRVGIQGTFRSINPMGAGDYNNDVDVHNLVYDTLLKTDPAGELVPWAGEQPEQVDDTTIEITLRDDLTFHDGEPVTAEDVAFTYEYFKEWEVGLYVNFLQPLESAEAVDERTVRFTLNEPAATFTAVTMASVPILPQHIWEGLVEREGLSHPADWGETQMVGSGPYTVRAVSPTEGVELDRNEEHFSPPVSEAFQSRYFADQQGIFRAMQSGAVYFHQSGRFGPSSLEQAELEDHLEVGSMPGITVRWMAFSFREDSPFRDFPFREAIAHTFDYDSIVNAIFRGHGDPGTGTIGPGNEFWQAPIPHEETDGPYWRPFDLDRARQILTDAGYRWDEEGRLHFPEDHEPVAHYDGS